MYSFHASTAAYMEFWNHTYASLNPESSSFLSCRIVWKAFVQESIRVIGFSLNQHLTLKDDLPIKDVTQQAFNHLGQNGLISVVNGHACSECLCW